MPDTDYDLLDLDLQISIEIIEAVRAKGRCDVVDDLAKLLPMRLIGQMLGHPPEDYDMLTELADQMHHGGCGPQYVDDATNDAFDRVEMYGKTIQEGQQVMMMYPAAMRDPRVFEDPDQFDIRRPAPSSNLSFGHGRHLCLGNALARMELRVFFDELLRRIPHMEHDPERQPEKRRSSFIRGLSSLPVLWKVA